MIASYLPEDVVLDHLINLPYSLKNLGGWNRNGWGFAYYNDSEPLVLRGELPANTDPNFDLAAQELAGSGARIGVGHVRLAASGASGIPNPHPFIRYKGGKWWAFGHNGVLSKTILKSLVGSEYLAENPPTVGDNWEDPDVIDSDLYMLYILKCIEEKNWNINEGIAKAVTDISEADSGAMNFFLTDGETLWGFRRGYTLYYYYSETSPQYSAIASQPPTSTQDGWTALYDYNLIILTGNNPPYVIDDITTIEFYELTVASSSITGITYTINGSERMTPHTEMIPEGFYVLVMPSTHDGYVWFHWLEDGDTNRIKTVTMNTNTTLTGVFTLVPPPPPVGGRAFPINMPMIKPELQIPWIWLSTIILPLVLTVVYVKKRKRNIEINF